MTLKIEGPPWPQALELLQDQGLPHPGQPAQDEGLRQLRFGQAVDDVASIRLVAPLEDEDLPPAQPAQERCHGERTHARSPAVDDERPLWQLIHGVHLDPLCYRAETVAGDGPRDLHEVAHWPFALCRLRDPADELSYALINELRRALVRCLRRDLLVERPDELSLGVPEERVVHCPRQVVFRELCRAAKIDNARARERQDGGGVYRRDRRG